MNDLVSSFKGVPRDGVSLEIKDLMTCREGDCRASIHFTHSETGAAAYCSYGHRYDAAALRQAQTRIETKKN